MTMNKRTLINWLCLSGIIAVVLYVAATLIAPFYYPGYDWTVQAVSDLGALTSPSRLAWLIIWSLGSACALLCVVLTSIVFQHETNKLVRLGVYIFAIMTWLSLGYTMFPLSEGGNANTAVDIAHIYVVTPLVTITTILSLIFIIIGGRRDDKYKLLSLLAGITLLSVMIGAVGIGIGGQAHFGLFERFTVYSIMAFTAILGIFGFKRTVIVSKSSI